MSFGANSLVIDSSNNVGIGTGTTAPVAKLEVNGGGAATTGGTLVVRQDGDTNSDGIALTSSNATSHRFWKDSNGKLNVGPSNLPSALVQDLSGNVYVGTTSTTPWTAATNSSADSGIALRSDGIFAASAYKSTANSGNVALFNRTGTDGTVCSFLRNGTTVGSIGTVDGDLLVHASAAGHKGLRFGNGYVAPTNNTGTIEDNTTSLGLSGQRFKDLYLSGHANLNTAYASTGIYLGAYATPNLLDDYEFGTFQPIMAGDGTSSGTQTYAGTNFGRYTKVGNMVTCYFDFQVTALGTTGGTYATVRGLPFTVAQSHIGGGNVNYYSALSNNSGPLQLYAAANSAYLMRGAATYVARTDLTNNTRLMGTLVYYTTD